VSVDFSDVQIVHKFAGRVTHHLDFTITIFFNFINISEMVQDRAILWRADRNFFVIYRIVSFSMTLHEP